MRCPICGRVVPNEDGSPSEPLIADRFDPDAKGYEKCTPPGRLYKGETEMCGGCAYEMAAALTLREVVFETMEMETGEKVQVEVGERPVYTSADAYRIALTRHYERERAKIPGFKTVEEYEAEETVRLAEVAAMVLSRVQPSE